MDDACPRCGSNKLVPGLQLKDHIGDFGIRSRDVEVNVDGTPGAWVFKDTVSGTLTVDVCGECGHAELRVSNFQDLYDSYQKSRLF